MQQTPAHSVINAELLSLLPVNARHVVEVGCMLGVLAEAYRKQNPSARYTGIEIDLGYAAVASARCNVGVVVADVEDLLGDQFATFFPSDCWVFGDSLEHLRDPWRLLAEIRKRIDGDGCIVACMPNAQHWGVQLRLAGGLLRYDDSGLMDRTHLRWFTRTTMIEMFNQAGWRVEAGLSRSLPQIPPAAVFDAIRSLAAAAGVDPGQAVADAGIFQYLFRCVPA